MADIGNYRLQRTADPRHDDLPVRPPALVWVILLLLVALGAGYYWISRNRLATAPPPGTAASAAAPAAAPPVPLGGTPEAIDVPPLGQSDEVVRTLVQTLSTHPRVLAWMATDGLIRNFTVVVDNIADGQTPSRHLGVLKPAGPFTTKREGDALHIDPASYARYNDLAAAVASIDARTAASVYATLKPRIEEAHRELGSQTPFDSALQTAIVRLVQTPAGPGPAGRVMPKGGEGYQYADARFESLSGPQKLLLRMGPANARIVQEKLREIGLALGISAARLAAVGGT